MIYYIPLGVVTRTSILANIGPKIPVEMSLIGHVEMDYEFKSTSAGINNTYLELIAEPPLNRSLTLEDDISPEGCKFLWNSSKSHNVSRSRFREKIKRETGTPFLFYLLINMTFFYD